MDDLATVVWLCRPGFEPALRASLAEAGTSALPPKHVPAGGVGWVAAAVPPTTRTDGPPAGPLVFERQRLEHAAWVPGTAPAELAPVLLSEHLPRLEAAPGPHVLHVATPDPAGGAGLGRRAHALQRRLLRTRALPGEPLAGPPDARRGTVWQVCVVADGVWSSVMPAARLTHPWPGGQHHARRDPAAPSRSVQKVEEALEVMGTEPRPDERAVDLGAAPGGWSYAFLRRGCTVVAVDNGPMKLPPGLPGRLDWRREDGLRYRPPAGEVPVDWLLSDMLVAPGVCLGLLRKWIGQGWARRLIVNVKVPQREPLVALSPVRDFLAGAAGCRWQLRQLYHDRREVTLMATCANPTPQPEGPHAGARRKPRRR